MKTRTNSWLMIAAILLLIGCILFAGTMSMLGWDFTKFSTVQYETNTYQINDTFQNVSISTDTADIIFTVSDDETCIVDCYEEENTRHSVTVENDTLIIKLIDERTVTDYIHYIGINIGTPRITIQLPETEYASLFIDESTGDIDIPKDFSFKDVDISISTGDVRFCATASGLTCIKGSTGDIRIENTTVGSLDLSVSTGDVIVSDVICESDVIVGVSTGKALLTDITCQNLTSRGNTGDLSLENVIAAEKFMIQRSTGDIKLKNSDACDLFIQTDTGDITGTLLTEKIFFVQTNTGDVEVPQTTTGGKCEINTDTGDVTFTIN